MRSFRAASFDLLVVAPRNARRYTASGGEQHSMASKKKKKEKKKKEKSAVQKIKEERDFLLSPSINPFRYSSFFSSLPLSSRQKDSNGDWRNPLPRWVLVNGLAPASSGLFPIISRSVHRLGDKRWNCCLQVSGRQLIARIAQTSRGLLLCQASRKKRVLSRERCPL